MVRGHYGRRRAGWKDRLAADPQGDGSYITNAHMASESRSAELLAVYAEYGLC